MLSPLLLAMIPLSHGAASQVCPEFSIEPYLTMLTETKFVLNWRLASKAASSFKVRSGSSGYRSISTTEALQHRVELNGLEPGKRYTYIVNDCFENSFDTRQHNGKLRFAVIGHTHGSEGFNHYPDQLLVEKLIALRPDLIVHTGDATYYSNLADYKEYYFDLFKDIASTVPIFVSPGNHDAGWPFIYGRDLTVFKELFNYPYPTEIKHVKTEAFYSIVESNVQFLFLSYTSDLSPNSPQRQWLERQLGHSKYDFNIVVYGGAQEGYYDRKSLLTFLAKHNVDLVLNGDGLQPRESMGYFDGLPIVFVGTGGADPHPLLYVEKERDYLTMKLLNASGSMGSVEWIYSKKKYPKRVDLLKMQHTKHVIEGRGLRMKFSFGVLQDSGTVSGIQIVPRLSGDSKNVYVFSRITPNDIHGGIRHEGGLRTQYQSFGPRDKLVTVAFPKLNPFKNEYYAIKELQVTFVGVVREDDLKLEELYLY